MDIDWCIQKPLLSWDDLRTTFKDANSRKAISPTQFNHQSTRGHCIMVLEVEIPDPLNKAIKKRGRIYICDLAGTEPAGGENKIVSISRMYTYYLFKFLCYFCRHRVR